ncbi:hypothetical protein CSC12_1913 [Klebsiella michiganensis]|nr:hypothetical protein CSC12_1913 [Klebsiella michiganensis]
MKQYMKMIIHVQDHISSRLAGSNLYKKQTKIPASANSFYS